MAQTTLYLHEGTTEIVDLYLSADGAPFSLTGTDHSVFVTAGREGAGTTTQFSTADASPKLVVQTAAKGHLRFTAGTTSFSSGQSPYRAYVRVFQSSTTPVDFPDAQTAEIDEYVRLVVVNDYI